MFCGCCSDTPLNIFCRAFFGISDNYYILTLLFCTKIEHNSNKKDKTLKSQEVTTQMSAQQVFTYKGNAACLFFFFSRCLNTFSCPSQLSIHLCTAHNKYCPTGRKSLISYGESHRLHKVPIICGCVIFKSNLRGKKLSNQATCDTSTRCDAFKSI